MLRETSAHGAGGDGDEPSGDPLSYTDAPPTIEDIIAAATISGSGNVACALPPYDSLRVGRLTTWPEDRPPEKRSVSMKCFIHTGQGIQCAAAKARSKCTDEQLLRWLFSAEALPDSPSKAQRKDIADRHTKASKDGTF